MLVKTRGIVINYIKFKEQSIIVKIYTENLGLQSYIVNSVRSAKARQKMALFQPLTLLDLVVYHRKDRKQLNRISEVKCRVPYQSIPFDYHKISVSLFISEVLAKALMEEEANTSLFHFLEKALGFFDQAGDQSANFHLYFLVKLSPYLGFGPSSGRDLLAQLQENLPPGGGMDVWDDQLPVLDQLIREDFSTSLKMNSRQRSEVIDLLLDYYRCHLDNFDRLRSLEILRELNR
ncbi:MAG: DNA repair protein RecO [Bacteroidota bacterium]